MNETRIYIRMDGRIVDDVSQPGCDVRCIQRQRIRRRMQIHTHVKPEASDALAETFFDSRTETPT